MPGVMQRHVPPVAKRARTRGLAFEKFPFESVFARLDTNA
jgi:hypothetical protein